MIVVTTGDKIATIHFGAEKIGQQNGAKLKIKELYAMTKQSLVLHNPKTVCITNDGGTQSNAFLLETIGSESMVLPKKPIGAEPFLTNRTSLSMATG